MRLLFIANDFPSPIEPTKAVFNLHLTRALAQKHEVHVISPVAWTDELRARREGLELPPGRQTVLDGVNVYYPRYYFTPKMLRRYYGTFYWHSIRRTVKMLIQSKNPEAVIAYWVHPDGHGAVKAARLAGVPSAVIVGGSDVQMITKDPNRKRRVVEVLQSIDSVVTVNQDLQSKVQALGVSPDKIHVWQQGVDEAVFYPGNRRDARKMLGIETELPSLLWVGRMVEVKGLEILIKAAALLRMRNLDFRLYLVGDGPLRESLEAQCASSGISNVVKFVGSRTGPALGDWYRAADLFVMSSWSEGLPNVLRESLACGTPFVSSNVGGIAEIAGKDNRLFPAGDASAMATEIIAALAQPPQKEFTRPATWAESADALVNIIQASENPFAASTSRPRRLVSHFNRLVGWKAQ